MPEGHGVLLEWNQDTCRGAMTAALFAMAILAGFLSLRGDGLWWAWAPEFWWWAWPLILLGGFGIYGASRNQWIAAGALWLQNRDEWVELYELTEVKLGASGTNQMLRLADSSGRRLSHLKLKDVQSNHALWDLVYNGILHSVVSGKADPPWGTRKALRLPAAPPEL